MMNSEILKALVASLPVTNEAQFHYVDLTKGFEVTLNFIDGQTALPDHTHEQTVYNCVLEGEITVTVNGQNRNLVKGDWIQIHGGQIHSVTTRDPVVLLELWQK